MKAHMRKLLKIFTSRVVVVGLALLVQLSWYLLFLNRLANYSIVVNGFFRVLSVIILLYLIRKDENSAYKIGLDDPHYGDSAFGRHPLCNDRQQKAGEKTGCKDGSCQRQYDRCIEAK